MLVANETAESTSCARIHAYITRLAVMPPDTSISVKEIHQMCNDVFGAWHPDDGVELRDVILSKLSWYNEDKRGSEYSRRARVVHAEIGTMQAALGCVAFPARLHNERTIHQEDYPSVGPNITPTDEEKGVPIVVRIVDESTCNTKEEFIGMLVDSVILQLQPRHGARAYYQVCRPTF